MVPLSDGAPRNAVVIPDRDRVMRFRLGELQAKRRQTRAGWGSDGPVGILGLNGMRRSYPPGFNAEMPYAAITARMESMAPSNRGLEERPHEISCGVAVEGVFDKLRAQVTLPNFRPCVSG
jgi:hypothetical protein